LAPQVCVTILPRIRQGHDSTKGRDMARTRYQYGEIVIKHGKAHDSYMGRWKEDVRLPNGSLVRRKRSKVLGIVGNITESPSRTQPFRPLPKNGVTKRFQR
jgi:hypothetical protein